MLDLCLADSRVLYFWYVLESTHKFIIELHALQCLFVGRSNKKQRRGRIISNFTKGETFSSLITSKCSWGQSHNVAPLLHPSAFIPPSVWPRREYIRTLNWKEIMSLMFLIPTSRNKMMDTFIIVNITRTCKR